MYFDFEMKNSMKIHITSIFIPLHILTKVIVSHTCTCLSDSLDITLEVRQPIHKHDFLYILCYEVEIR